MRDEVDVVIVGAGAAGIAAARRLRERGRDALLVEAMERVGGRAHTVERAGCPLDLGCGWLHSADRNPLVGLAEAGGFPLDRSRAAWRKQLRDLGFTAAEQHAAARAYSAFGERARSAPPASDRAGDLLARDDPWRPYVDGLSGYMNGAELDSLSVADFLAYDDAATDANWRVPGGYGALIARLAAGLPVALGARVRAVDHGGARALVETDRGIIRAKAVIVTVPTPVLAAIRFTPAIDTHLQAAAGLPLGLADKLFLGMREPDAVPPESHLLGNPHASETGSYYLRPFGRPLIECFFGGAGARAIEAAGTGAAEALAREELGRLLGGEFVSGLVPFVETAWGREPTIGGSYSHALPGHAAARATLAAPPSERLALAGEACSAHDFSTAHGAWKSGTAAAEFIEANLR